VRVAITESTQRDFANWGAKGTGAFIDRGLAAVAVLDLAGFVRRCWAEVAKGSKNRISRKSGKFRGVSKGARFGWEELRKYRMLGSYFRIARRTGFSLAENYCKSTIICPQVVMQSAAKHLAC
jgi:hypothetical protein